MPGWVFVISDTNGVTFAGTCTQGVHDNYRKTFSERNVSRLHSLMSTQRKRVVLLAKTNDLSVIMACSFLLGDTSKTYASRSYADEESNNVAILNTHKVTPKKRENAKIAETSFTEKM